jgi:hypothetical protein
MASPNTSQRSLTWVWMLGSVVLVLGFLVWLGVTSEPSNLVAVREAAEEEVDDSAPAEAVTGEQLQTDAAGLRGRMIRVAGMEVAGTIGQRAAWLQLPNGNPFLVVLPPEAAGTLQYGQRVTVEGVVRERTDEALAQWESEGIVQSDGDRMQAEFASDYIEVRRVTQAGGE